ncbi:MAG TPA: diguanylate cyclase [Anaerovoracaceae bacterium]|nr:diguanylate cyclase [Anaerovoracaceae bacterium]
MAESFEEYARYKYAIENIHDIIWELDTNLNFTFVSPNSKELSGYEPDEMVGRSLLDFLSEESKEYVSASTKEHHQGRINGTLRKPYLYEVEFKNKDGTSRWFEVSAKPLFQEDQFAGYIGTSRDISEKKTHEIEVKKYIEELEHTNRKLDKLATYDMLTGVYNRRKFEQDVALAADKKEKFESPFAIIMFDIDGFKLINDQYGHKMGDVILQQMTSVVKGVLRETDKLFRWGGDEFIILLQETSLKNAFKAAEKVRRTVAAYDFEIENSHVAISLGVGEYQRGDRIDQFLSYVDNALLIAKAKGKNRVEFRP